MHFHRLPIAIASSIIVSGALGCGGGKAAEEPQAPPAPPAAQNLAPAAGGGGPVEQAPPPLAPQNYDGSRSHVPKGARR